jgi:hypothetical protein
MDPDLIDRARNVFAVNGLEHGLNRDFFGLHEELQRRSTTAAARRMPGNPAVIAHRTEDIRRIARGAIEHPANLVQRGIDGGHPSEPGMKQEELLMNFHTVPRSLVVVQKVIF